MAEPVPRRQTTTALWLVWSLPAVLAVQLLLMLVASEPNSSWRGDGYMVVSTIASLLSAAVSLAALWILRAWPVALRVCIALLHIPLLAGALLMSGF